ncbi:MAG: O-antigen ligase family protein [Chitinophagaceae bacterium]|nr:O-antigen ligase family protein [Chitinophagaceae bacterium]
MIAPVHKDKFLFSLLAVFFIAVIAFAAFTEQYLLTTIPFAVVLFYAGWQNRNLVFLLLLTSLPLSFEYNFSPTLGTDIPDEMLMLFVAGLFIAYWVYSPAAISKKAVHHPLFFLLLASFVWMTISVLFSAQQLISLKFLLAKSWYIGAFVIAPLIIFKDKKHIRSAAIAITGAMMLVAIIVLIRHYKHDFRFADINDATVPFFRNHVNYSAMLVCMIPLLLAFYSGTRSKQNKLLLAGVILISLIALFFSYARGAWVALIIGCIAWSLIKMRLLYYGYIAAVIISIAALFWVKSNDRYLRYANDYQTTIFHKDFKEHLVATYKLKDVSTAERFYRWIAGVRMIKDNWLTGYGPNAFYYNYKGYAVPAFKTWVSDNTDHSTVHNYFLLTTIEQGVPGLLLLIIVFGAMLYYAQYLYHRVKDPFYKVTAMTTGVVTTMIIVLNLLSDLIETDKIGSLFFLCISVLIVTDMKTKNAKTILHTACKRGLCVVLPLRRG